MRRSGDEGTRPARAEADTASSSGLAVARVDGCYRALAARPLPAGATIAVFHGAAAAAPDRFSVQIGASEHLAVPAGTGLEEMIDRYPWRFLNHACDPNAAVRGRRLVALRDVAAFEQVTFDYDTTEYEMAEPFVCACGAATCRGTIRGFRHLGAGERARLRPLLAAHLVAIFDNEHALDA